jgi:hypothetical protein
MSGGDWISLSTMQSSTLKTRALVVIAQADRKTYDAKVVEKVIEPLKDNQVLVSMRAAAFNHRDVRLSKHFLASLLKFYYVYSSGSVRDNMGVSGTVLHLARTVVVLLLPAQ